MKAFPQFSELPWLYLSLRQYVDEVTAIAKHFSIQSPSLPYQHQIQSVALAEQFWGESRHSLPFRLSGALGNIPKFRLAFPHLKRVILVRGRSGEEEVDSWNRYSGITLLDSNMDKLEDDILEIVILILAFAEDKRTRRDEILEVAVMERPQGR